MWDEHSVNTHTHTHISVHLLYPAWLCMTAVKWDVKLLYYVSTACNSTPSLSLTHTETSLSGRGDVWNLCGATALQPKDTTSISAQMTVVIIPFSSPHHRRLHHLTFAPASHIRPHTQTHGCISLQSSWGNSCAAAVKNRGMAARPPPCHRAKPSACSVLMLGIFWTSAVIWIP